METIAELVGGCADGVQLKPDDPTEPDDWPWYLEIEGPNGAVDVYEHRVGKDGIHAFPVVVNGKRVYYFDCVDNRGDS